MTGLSIIFPSNWITPSPAFSIASRIRPAHALSSSLGSRRVFARPTCKVTRKYVKDRHALVDLEIWGENQRGEITTPGLATVILPSRDPDRLARSFRYGGVIECRDGFVELLTLEQRQWHGLVELMGYPEWAMDAALEDAVTRSQRGDFIDGETCPGAFPSASKLCSTSKVSHSNSDLRNLVSIPANGYEIQLRSDMVLQNRTVAIIRTMIIRCRRFPGTCVPNPVTMIASAMSSTWHQAARLELPGSLTRRATE